MPYHDQYEQKISDDKDIKQTMVDVALILLSGNMGEYRGQITLAENLQMIIYYHLQIFC